MCVFVCVCVCACASIILRKDEVESLQFVSREEICFLPALFRLKNNTKSVHCAQSLKRVTDNRLQSSIWPSKTKGNVCNCSHQFHSCGSQWLYVHFKVFLNAFQTVKSSNHAIQIGWVRMFILNRCDYM